MNRKYADLAWRNSGFLKKRFASKIQKEQKINALGQKEYADSVLNLPKGEQYK